MIACATIAEVRPRRLNQYQSANDTVVGEMEQGAGDLSHLPLDVRCDNWGAWQRGGSTSHQVESKEGGYRSPQRGHWEESVTAVPVAINAFDGQLIEHGVCLLPLYQHLLLRGWHCKRSRPNGYRLDPVIILRMAARISHEQRGCREGFTGALAMAYVLLGETLKVPAVVRKQHARDVVMRALAELD